MISREFAAQFATDWIAAWNSRDLAKVLAHYADDFEMSSPYIARIAGDPRGMLMGQAHVGVYWAKALNRMPELHFELIEVLAGVDSVVICYRGISGSAAEVFFFDKLGTVIKAFAHYAQDI